MKSSLVILALVIAASSAAQLRLPSFISDGMVLQQQKANRIWGWSKPNDRVTVEFMGKKYGAFASSNGEWKVFLDPVAAGNVGAITISTANEKKELKNILAGEVWVCGGQSNMEWKMSWMADTYKDEMQTANNDNIRFVVARRTIDNKEDDDIALDRGWSPINPSTIGDCSAVAYWYAKKLNQQLHVPIGLVVTNWGGTPAESWTSYEGLHSFSNYTDTYEQKIKPVKLDELARLKNESKENFDRLVREKKRETIQQWIKTDFDDKTWPEMYLPKKWEEQGFPLLDGIVVFRIAFTVDKKDAGKEAELNLPPVDDMDSTYINGTFIGTKYSWNELRKYKIPAGILKAGKNELVIDVLDNQGGGGLDANENNFYVAIGGKKIQLKGNAKYAIFAEIKDPIGGAGPLEIQPAVLFNGMIAPFLPLTIRGVIWYQGESNAEKAYEYRSLFSNMITDWRNHWGLGDFPFIFVQLASYNPVKKDPGESTWAELREAQAMALALPNTAMAVAVDIGNPDNIHPLKKKEVGDRLAANAMKLVYGDRNEAGSGPWFKSYAIEGNKVRISFNNTGSGLVMKGDMLKSFAIAGEDKKFTWADAVINGNDIMVSSPSVAKPTAVRYAWADSPVDANLYNKEGFPAVPFRTDDWKGITQLENK